MIYMLSVSMVLLFLMTLTFLWRVGVKHWTYWIIVPFLSFNLGLSWYILTEELKGWPLYSTPGKDQQLLFATVSKPTIFVLVIKEGSVEPRLYGVPYTDNMATKVQEALKSIKKGQRVMTSRGVESTGPLEFYNFQYQDKYPKNY